MSIDDTASVTPFPSPVGDTLESAQIAFRRAIKDAREAIRKMENFTKQARVSTDELERITG